METKTKNVGYIAPEVDVIWIKSQGVLCASFDSLEEYQNDEWDPFGA